MKSKEKKLESDCKKEKKQKHKIVIGIDQSYADTGICIAVDNQVVLVKDCKSRPNDTNTQKRKRIAKVLEKCFASCNRKSAEFQNCEVICIIERIRVQSSKPGTKHFISLNYIKGMGALDCLIVDIASKYNIPVYSVDTRSWKSQVVGTSKPMQNNSFVPPEKWPTIKYCIAQDYRIHIIDVLPDNSRKKHYLVSEQGLKYTYNDNRADSICIALYGFLPQTKQKLEVEH